MTKKKSMTRANSRIYKVIVYESATHTFLFSHSKTKLFFNF